MNSMKRDTDLKEEIKKEEIKKEEIKNEEIKREEIKIETPSGDSAAVSDASEPEPSEESVSQDEPDVQAQMAELTDRLQRTMADFDNYRKRTQKERSGMRDEGVCQTIEKLLPVLDNFERAMDASSAEDSFAVGMQMILKQFTCALKDDMGICEIPAMNESFNPNVHFAVSHIDDDRYADNEVIEVLQKGYKYKEKVIRPSMVRVAN